MEKAWTGLVREARRDASRDDVLFDRAVGVLKAFKIMEKKKMVVPSFGGADLRYVVEKAKTHKRLAVRRACGAVAVELLGRDAAFQGRALTAGAVERRGSDLIISDGNEWAPPAPKLRLPDGVEDRKFLTDISQRPDPQRDVVAVPMSPSLLAQLEARERPVQRKEEVVKTKKLMETYDLWQGDVVVKTSSQRDVDARVVATRLILGGVDVFHANELRLDPQYLSCKRVGEFQRTGTVVLDVVRLRLDAQDSEIEAIVSRSCLDAFLGRSSNKNKDTTLFDEVHHSDDDDDKEEDVFGSYFNDGGNVETFLRARIRLPLFCGEEIDLPIWRVPETTTRATRCLTARGIQLLVAAKRTPLPATRAVFLAVVGDINRGVLAMDDKRAALNDTDRRRLVEIRDSLVAALKKVSAIGLLDNLRGEHHETRDALAIMEATRQRGVQGLLRIAGAVVEPEPEAQVEQGDFVAPRVVLGETRDQDHALDAPESPTFRPSVKAIGKAEALAVKDKALNDRKLAARHESAELSRLRLAATRRGHL